MQLHGTPSALGFHLPAEWETHTQCRMGWPVSTASKLCYYIIISIIIFFITSPISVTGNALITGERVLHPPKRCLQGWQLSSQNLSLLLFVLALRR